MNADILVSATALLLLSILVIYSYKFKLSGVVLFIFAFSISFIITQSSSWIYGWDSFSAIFPLRDTIQFGILSDSTYKSPLFYLLYSSIGVITEVNTVSVISHLPTVLFTILAASYYIGLRSSLSDWSAHLSTVFIIVFWEFADFHSWAIKETMALSFVFLAFYSLYKLDMTKSHRILGNRYDIMLLLFIFAVTFTHTYSSLIAVIIMASYYVSYYLVRSNILSTFFAVNYEHDISSQKLWVPIATAIIIPLFYYIYMEVSAIFSIYPLLNLLNGSYMAPSTTSSSVGADLYTELRLAWNYTYQIVCVLFIGLVLTIEAFIFKGIKIIRGHLTFVLASSALLVLWVSVFISEISLGGPRVLSIIIVFAFPITVSAVKDSSVDNIINSLLILVIVISVISFPPFVLSGSGTPAYAQGELGSGFSTEHKESVQWVGDHLKSAPVADVKHYRIWTPAGIDPVAKSKLYISPENSINYIYITPSLLRGGKLGDESRIDEKHPIIKNGVCSSGCSKLYTTGDNSVAYLKQLNNE
ncbi:hypothetical protein [Halorubrum ezzemoulense]|uniref:hypothetical protein n=1 Tax=Halorubrum ezzemoulense TaxID=337243 RepID=UPI00232B86AF|nr:hypothetical protein [Halorubrum ezzemoulense]MDB9235519.1 hypothetical protein [Halorubrum ezzemoulense]